MKIIANPNFTALGVVMFVAPALTAQDYKSGVDWVEPPIVTPGASDRLPPSDAIILFDGTDTSAWRGGKWKVENGELVASKGNIYTRQAFGDIQLHVEWSAPAEVKGSSQGRGNSGIFLMDRYEVQVLDSYENQTYFDGQASSVYKQTPPMVNAMRKPGEWNTYDILWTAPRFKVSGELQSPAYVTVIHNGVLTLNHFELMGHTNFSGPPAYTVHAEKLPIRIQDHGNPVRFRNIWLREFQAPVGTRASGPYVEQGQDKVSFSEVMKKKAEEKLRKDVLNAFKSLIEEKIDRRQAPKRKEKPKAEPAPKKQVDDKDRKEQGEANSKKQGAESPDKLKTPEDRNSTQVQDAATENSEAAPEKSAAVDKDAK